MVACIVTGIVTCRTASRQRQPASSPEKAPDPHSHLIGFNVLSLQPRGKGSDWIGAVIEVHIVSSIPFSFSQQGCKAVTAEGCPRPQGAITVMLLA